MLEIFRSSIVEDLTTPPSPFSNETAANRANNRTKKGPKAIDSGRDASLLGMEQVRDDTSSDGQTARASNSGEEAKDNKRAYAWGKSAADLPHAEKNIGASQYWPATIDFRQGRQD